MTCTVRSAAADRGIVTFIHVFIAIAASPAGLARTFPSHRVAALGVETTNARLTTKLPIVVRVAL